MRGGTRWAAIAAGAALAVPLTLASPAAEAVQDGHRPAVRLLLDLTTSRVTAGGREGFALTYTVRVHAEDGVAHGTTLHLTAERPTSWTRHTPGCTRSDSGRQLRCTLGDVGEQPAERTATLRIPSSMMSTPSANPLSVVAVADASNAPRRTVRAVFAFSASTPTTDPTPTADPTPTKTPSPSGHPTPKLTPTPGHCTSGAPCPSTQPSGPDPTPSGHDGSPAATPSGGKPTTPSTHPSSPGPTATSGHTPCKTGKPGPGRSACPTTKKPSPTGHSSAHCAVSKASVAGRPCPSGQALGPKPSASGGGHSPAMGPCKGGTPDLGGGPCVAPKQTPPKASAPKPTSPKPTPPESSAPKPTPDDSASSAVVIPPGVAPSPSDQPSLSGQSGEAGVLPSGVPTGFSVPDLPTVAPPKAVVLPPVNASAGPVVAPGETRMTLMAPAGMDEADEADWAVVIGIALVAEIGLLWGVACVGLLRRRWELQRAVAGG